MKKFDDIEKLLLDKMQEGVIQLNGQGTVVYANASALQTFEAADNGLVGQKLGPLLLLSENNDDFFQLILDAALNLGKSQQGIVTFELNDKLKYLKAVVYGYIVAGVAADNTTTHDLLITISFQDLSYYVFQEGLDQEINELNDMNRSLDVRNRLLSKIFGNFVFWQDDMSDILNKETIQQLTKGVSCEIAVIQSDLRGYTALSNQLNPEDFVTVTTYYTTSMCQVIQSNYGMVIDWQGDGITSIFVFKKEEDRKLQCDWAIATAVEMQRRMPEVNAWLAEHGYDVNLKMGIGIDNGPAVLGFIGSNERRSISAMGEVIHTADEIQGNTIEGDIFISQRVMDRVQADLDIAKELDLYLKDEDQHIKAYKVRGIGEPFNLECPVLATMRQKLKQPQDIEFYVIKGKLRSNQSLVGSIIELSNQEIGLDYAGSLESLTNISFDIGNESVYGKVIDKKDGCYIISLTSIPSGFSAWSSGLFA